MNDKLILADTHMHSNNSFDADCKIDDICQTAISKNINVIAITDHCEIDMLHNKTMLKDIDNAFSEMVFAKEKYKQDLKVLCGIELGQLTQNIELSKQLINKYPYDYVITSVHSIKGKQDFYFMSEDELLKDGQNLLRNYFLELIDLANLALGDTIAHLDYPLRYFVQKNISFDIEPFQKYIDTILDIIIKKQIALECNTSGLRQVIGRTLPSYDVLQKYFNMGGRLLTIGSDAHFTEHIYLGVNETINILKDIGFKQAVYFENRKPVFYKL